MAGDGPEPITTVTALATILIVASGANFSAPATAILTVYDD
jgi:hypothetical protein